MLRVPRSGPLAAVLSLTILSAAPAVASGGQTVTAQPVGTNQWSPSAVTVAPGDTVTFANNQTAPGYHDVFIEDPQGHVVASNAPSPTPWSLPYTFGSPGTYTFYCSVHRSQGMVGTVTVTGGSPPPGDPYASPTPASTSTPVAPTASTPTPPPSATRPASSQRRHHRARRRHARRGRHPRRSRHSRATARR